MGLVFFRFFTPYGRYGEFGMSKILPRGVGIICPPGQPILGTFFFGLFLIFLCNPGDFPSSCVFIIYSARKAGDTARKTATTKLMRLLQRRAKVIWGKYRLWFFETILYQKPDFEQGGKILGTLILLIICRIYELFVDFINYLGGRLKK